MGPRAEPTPSLPAPPGLTRARSPSWATRSSSLPTTRPTDSSCGRATARPRAPLSSRTRFRARSACHQGPCGTSTASSTSPARPRRPARSSGAATAALPARTWSATSPRARPIPAPCPWEASGGSPSSGRTRRRRERSCGRRTGRLPERIRSWTCSRATWGGSSTRIRVPPTMASSTFWLSRFRRRSTACGARMARRPGRPASPTSSTPPTSPCSTGSSTSPGALVRRLTCGARTEPRRGRSPFRLCRTTRSTPAPTT